MKNNSFKRTRFLYFGIVLASVVSLGLFMQSCNKEDIWDEIPNEKTNFPVYAEEYGKSVAREIHNMVENLNRMGIDYSNADKSVDFQEQFYKDLYKVNPIMANNRDMINSLLQIDPVVFAEKIRNLTDIQIEFIQRIIKECEKSVSYQDLSNRLMSVNQDIYSHVPEIEQERLFNITAVLYYGINEVQNLEKQGQMMPTPHNNTQLRLKSGSESGGSGGWCRKFLATVWTIAIGEPTPVGEIVAAIATVVVAGVYLYEITVCGSSSTSSSLSNTECAERYYNCVQNGELPSWKCYDCFVYCQGQHVWDCPRPY